MIANEVNQKCHDNVTFLLHKDNNYVAIRRKKYNTVHPLQMHAVRSLPVRMSERGIGL